MCRRGARIVGGGCFPVEGARQTLVGCYFLEEELACAVEEAHSLQRTGLISLTEEALACAEEGVALAVEQPLPVLRRDTHVAEEGTLTLEEPPALRRNHLCGGGG